MQKLILLLLIVSQSSFGEVWQKPPYRPDENHLPRENVYVKEAQEERPKGKEKEKTEEQFKEIDEEMNEGVELGQ